jgi:uracil-DNA glycosylase
MRPHSERLRDIAGLLRGTDYLPAPADILRVFDYPLDEVKVLIVGQDPYPTRGHAVGLSFSVAPETSPLPRTLVNILTEYSADLGHPQPSSGDLSPWAEQGVFLLNRVLTVRPGLANSHAGIGWEVITEAAVVAIAARNQPLVSILWGKHAQTLTPLLDRFPVIQSAHPSPLSAARGFFGTRPWTRANELLEQQGSASIDWKLP